jgi:hypothetical protein
MLTKSVNYFGHAAVASWRAGSAGSAGVALGAMLPDFATMCRGRLAGSSDEAITAGIALHHETDRIFHQLAPVTALMRELDAHLLAGGCARGPRRAVAHIGVELLLDGLLVSEEPYRAAFLAALGHPASSITWREPEDATRFVALLSRLRSYGVPDDLRDPSLIVHRLHRMLSHRPLLAPSATDLVAIRAALVAHRARVEVALPTVLRAVRAAL